MFWIKKIKRNYIVIDNFTKSIFALFLGFISGNLFGTFLNFFRNYTNWDGFIIIVTIRATRWV